MMEKKPSRSIIPLKISLVYALAGAGWILFSDLVLSIFIREPAAITRLQTLKGWFFITVTTLLLYGVLRRNMSSVEKSALALRESEEKFHMLVETASGAIFIYREKLLLANQAMERLTGYSKLELLGMNFYDLVHPDFKGPLREHCEALARQAAHPMRCEFKLITKSGDERWVDFSSSIIMFEGAQAGLGTAFDITELKITMEALRESEERYRLLVDNIRDYEIFLLDPEGKIISWNIGGEMIKGYRAEEIIGKRHDLFFTEEDRRRGVPGEELKTAAWAGRSEMEGWRVKKDGSRFWANVITTAMYDEKGGVSGFSKVIRDITARKKAEDTLRESEERHRVIAETASDAIITIDGESKVLLANKAVEKLFGWKSEELIGQSLTILMPERYRERHLQGVKRFIETGQRHVSWAAIDVEGLRKNDSEVPLEISYGFFEKEGSVYFTGIARDMTERRLAEKEKEYKELLERFSRDLESLVAERTMSLMGLRLADRVRSPAMVIAWNGKKLLSRMEGLRPSEREACSAIIEQAEKLEAIVKEYQGLLRGRRPSFSYEDINEIIRDVFPIIEREASRKGIVLESRLSPVPVKINAQKDLLKMAVFTILRNAIEATPSGGRVFVESYPEADNVILAISDTGPGIPRELLNKLFDPAYSALIYRFGVGLPIINQIVSEHLGKIEVESEPGKGTTFRLAFPVRWMEKAEKS